MESFSLSLDQGQTLLDGLLKKGVSLARDCGACSVVVQDGFHTLSPAGEDEQDLLERAGASQPGTRLACQATGRGGDLVIELRHHETPHAGPARGRALPIALTQRAAKHLAAQLAKRGGVAVRLAVHPAGCSGLRYRVDHADSIGGDDVIFEIRGLRIAVDAGSLPYLQGTTLDLVQEGLGRRLRLRGPPGRRRAMHAFRTAPMPRMGQRLPWR